MDNTANKQLVHNEIKYFPVLDYGRDFSIYNSDMKHYSIVSFNFNGYDILREPDVKSSNCDYQYVTDATITSDCWTPIIDMKLVNTNPIYSSYYVRYHPFEFTDSDTVVVLDSSIRIKDSLDDIIQAFIDSDADLCVMCTNYPNDERKLDDWQKTRESFNRNNLAAMRRYISERPCGNCKGSLGTAFSIYRKSEKLIKFLHDIWETLLILGEFGIPNRLDEIVYHGMLYGCGLKIYPVSIQVIQSSYMDYCIHGRKEPVPRYKNYDQYYYLNNIPVKPYRFDRNGRFKAVYKYNTEAILLTKYLNAADLREWLNHHIYKCGFDHIAVYDNESAYDVKTVCADYPNVSYEHVEGTPMQYRIYDEHFKKSQAKWIMPIDDDEYMSFSDNFRTVYDVIVYYENKFPHMNMLCVRWKHMFPKKFHAERIGPVLEWCTEENPKLAEKFMHLGDRTVKTIVRNYGDIHYENTEENPAGGHIPKNSTYLGGVLFDGSAVQGCGVSRIPIDCSDEKIRLLHCRYKGYTEYLSKIKDKVTISAKTPRKVHWLFDELLDFLP